MTAEWREDPSLTYPGKGRRWLSPLRYDNEAARNPRSLATRAHQFDKVCVKWTGRSLMCWLFQPRAAGHPVEPAVLLRTVGSSSGQFREVVLTAFAEAPERWIVIGSNSGFAADPAWVKNLRAHGVCWVWYRRRLRPARAAETVGDDREAVRQFVLDHHPVLPGYEAKVRVNAGPEGRQISFWRITLR